MGKVHIESGTLDRKARAFQASINPPNPDGFARVVALGSELHPYQKSATLFPKLTFDSSIVPTVDMLASNRSDETKKNLINAATKYFGVSGQILATRVNIQPETRKRLEARTLARIRKQLSADFPNENVCARIEPTMKQASEAMEYIHMAVRPDVRKPIHEEVMENTDPINSLALYTSGRGVTHETGIQRSVRQQLVLTHAAISIAQIDHENNKSNMEEMQKILNKRLFVAGADAEEQLILATCDNTTNTVIGIDGMTDKTDLAKVNGRTHVKHIPFYTRTAKFNIHDQITGKTTGSKEAPAFVEYGKKDESSSLTKMTRRAFEDQRQGGYGIFDTKHLKDLYRAQVVIFGNEVDAFNVLQDMCDALIAYHPQIVDIDPEFKTSDPNSAKKEKVYKLIVKSSSGPIEFRVVPIIEFLNDELHVGVYNNESQSHNGAAHELYETRRCAAIGERMFPNVTPETTSNTLRKKAKDLRNRYTD